MNSPHIRLTDVLAELVNMLSSHDAGTSSMSRDSLVAALADLGMETGSISDEVPDACLREMVRLGRQRRTALWLSKFAERQVTENLILREKDSRRSRPEADPERNDRICSAKETGKSYAQIAKQEQMSPSAVRSVIRARKNRKIEVPFGRSAVTHHGKIVFTFPDVGGSETPIV